MKDKLIMIIDDDPRNIFALAATLKARAFRTVSCSSVREALNYLADQEQPAIVLMDMMMPDIDGYEAISLMRKLPGGVELPLIAVTAQAMPGDRELCIQSGANDYISKPIDVDKLMQLLHAYLQ